METARPRWILGFDGTCGACAGVADAVSAACGDRLDVRPLQDEAVLGWRRAALGDDAAWKPVLLAVSGTGVRAWTGWRLAARLIGHLGVRGSVRVLRTLGRLRTMNRRGEVRRPGDLAPLQQLSRAHLVRDVGLGALTVMGMAARGTAPTATDTVGGWERTMEGSLPTTLPQLAVLPGVYRRVSYGRMTPEQRSAAWTDHLDGFRDAVSTAGTPQQAAFSRAHAYAGEPARFREPDLPLLGEVADGVVTAFGREPARLMIAVLGPDEDDDVDAVSCGCSVSSDYCSGGRRCRLNLQSCTKSSGGCGAFYSYPCDGLCA